MLDLAHAFSQDKSSRHMVLLEFTSLFYGPQEACRCNTAQTGTDALVGVAHGTQIEEKGQVPSCKDKECFPRAYMLMAAPLLRVELDSQL